MFDDFHLDRYSPESFSRRLRFSFPACVDAIAGAEENAISFAEDNGCAGDALLELRLALQEALANAVIHGCNEDETKTVQGIVACDGNGAVLIAVHDPGPGFDLGATALPDEEDADHGRGVELMRRLVDEVHFERNGAEVHLLKRCSTSARATAGKSKQKS
jgi:serine/threonine-protein kinase RsbW